MKDIDVVMPGSLFQTIGPVGTLKRIISSRDYFLSNNLDITVYNSNFYTTKDDLIDDKKVQKSNSLKSKIVSFLQIRAKKSFLLSLFFVEYNQKVYKSFVKKYLRQERNPDVIVFHDYMTCYWYFKLKKDTLPKTAMFIHSDCIPLKMEMLYYPKIKGTWYENKMLYRYNFTIEKVDRICCICEAGKRNINELYPNTISKTSLVINGITDLNDNERNLVATIKKERTDRTIKLCCVGSVSVRKAQRLVIKALALLSEEERKQYHLTVIGNGPDLDYCNQLIIDNNLNEQVSLIGAVPNKDVFKYLAASDIFVLLSENEGLPISIIEAMRAGLAIISTNVSGIPELVSNNNGLLIAPEEKELADVLKERGKYNWKEMGEASRSLFEERYRFERMRQDYVTMINTLL